MSLADRSLLAQHVGNDAAGSKDGNKVALPNGAILHQNAKGFDRLRVSQRVMRCLKLLYQYSHQLGELILLGSQWTAPRIELLEFSDHALVLLPGLDNARQRPRQELAVSGFIDCAT